MPASMTQPDFEQAAALCRGDAEPVEYGIILGSGLSILDELEDRRDTSYRDIPGFPPSTVEGHKGLLSIGRIPGGSRVAIARGRFHLYEGLPAASARYLVSLFAALGSHSVILSNAAGGLRADFTPGDLMLLSDQLNLTFRSSAEAGAVKFGQALYDPSWQAQALAIAGAQGLPVSQGVYVGLLGPSYETAGEIAFLSRFADAVGMSTVLEAQAAASLGLRALGVSCITNVAITTVGLAQTSHAEVMDVAQRASGHLERLLVALCKAS